MRVAGVGQVCLWPGGSLFIRRGGEAPTDVHAHHAIQVTLALDGPVRFQRGRGAPWVEYAGAAIASHQPHAFHPCGRVLGHIFVEPETTEGHALQDLYCASGLGALPAERLDAVASLLRARYNETHACAELVPVARAIIRELVGGAEPRATVDPRVLKAIEFIRSHLGGPLTLDEVAAAVYLSPSRFRHLFVEETGMQFRAYVLWQRLMRAFERHGRRTCGRDP